MLLGYTRASKKNLSFDSRIKALKDNGVVRQSIYQEAIAKGFNPALSWMINELGDKDTLVVLEPSRLSRNESFLSKIIALIKKSGAQIKLIRE